MKDEKKIRELSTQKLELDAKIRDLQAEIGRINIKLNEAGASTALIACW